ncbi:MAG TPA: hypothetical protein VFO79_01240 [Xanthomonadales bacterium]|nr:hypothetical protein [Xanthomonadales bacterium]
MRVALLACVLVACGKGGTTAKKHDAGIAKPDAAVVSVEPLVLGLPDLEAYRWRKRGGHPAFRVARTAEARQDWPTVVTTCKQALAADPSHLEAAWLLAAALGRQGKHDEILPPLAKAVAGDFGKWGHASLELPALQSFLATPQGQAWQARVEQDRNAFVQAIARSVIVEADGDLFAFDPQGARWHRITRTFGAVVGALRVPAANKLVYVTRTKKQYAIGTVDLARGRTARPIALGTDKPLVVTYQTKTNPGVWIGVAKTWQRLDENHKLGPLPPKTTRPPGPYLEVRGKKAKLRALPVANVTADWDDQGLASAIRIGKSNRVVSVPSPGLIDGNTAAWSADRARLAFVAQLDDQCTPGSIASAAFVADAATGKPQELERAIKGLAVEWVSDHELAVAGDDGVAIYDLQAGTKKPIADARGLVMPRQRPKCTATEPDAPDPEPDVDDPDLPESGPVEPLDAGH